MIDNSEEFVWRGDGEEAEVVVYAPEADLARRGFARALRAASLPGAKSPVFCATSGAGYGHVVLSGTHVSPELASLPERNLLLVAELPARDFAPRLGVEASGVGREVSRRFGEAFGALPRLGAAELRRVCEVGAAAGAERGFIEEEDLDLLSPLAGDGDALGRRALLAGDRAWGERPAGLVALSVGEALDARGLEEFGAGPGALLFALRTGAGDLGRLAFAAHRERTERRVLSGAFERVADPSSDSRSLAVAPAGTEEARDLLTASAASANYADAQLALALFGVRRALGGAVGRLAARAAWRVGGVLEEGEVFAHREGLAALKGGDVVWISAGDSGGALSVGLGTMGASAPAFSAAEDEEGRWLWEEVGLLGRLARLGVEGTTRDFWRD